MIFVDLMHSNKENNLAAEKFRRWVKVYMTDFFLFARSNPPNVLISTAKKFFHRDFPFPCFDVPKASNFTSGGVQNRETKNRGPGTIVTSNQDSKPREKQISPTFSYFLINNALLYHFVANWLAHNKKMTEKSVFREAWNPELASQSFPVSCFWCRSFVPHRKWNLTLLAHQNTGKENRYRKKIFPTLISTLGRFNRANKKNLSYTLKILGLVVQRLDNAIHRINHYPADSVVCFVNTYPLDSDLSGG